MVYQAHHRHVYSICLLVTREVAVAEDLTPEVFIHLFLPLEPFVVTLHLQLGFTFNYQSGIDAFPQM